MLMLQLRSHLHMRYCTAENPARQSLQHKWPRQNNIKIQKIGITQTLPAKQEVNLGMYYDDKIGGIGIGYLILLFVS